MYQAESWLNAYQYWADILLQQQMILHITIFGSWEFKSYMVINQLFFFSIFLFLLSIKWLLWQLTTTNVFYYILQEFWSKNPHKI